MDEKTLQEKLEKLEDLERRIQYYEDRQKIEQLMFRYAVNHNQKNMHRTSRFYAFSQEDAAIEIADRGNYVGEKNVRQLFEGNYQIQINEGSYLLHWQTTPMIEIAADGQTAHGVWLSLGAETVVNKQGVPVPVWNFIRWVVDFFKEEGEWKFYHYRVFMDQKSDFDKGWTKDFFHWDFMGKMPGASDDPPSCNYPYSPGGYVQHVVPSCPEPYETWTDETWFFSEEPSLNKTKKKKGED